MLQPIFPLFFSGITPSAFASANEPREDSFCYSLGDENFSLVTLGKEGVLYPGDTFFSFWSFITRSSSPI